MPTNPRIQPSTANSFEFIPSVPRSVAAKLLPYLNLVGEHHLSSLSLSSSFTSSDTAATAPQHPHAQAAYIEQLYRRRLAEAYFTEEVGSEKERLTPGYVTADKCDGKGDDTAHRPIPAVWQPTFVATAFPPPSLRSNPEEEAEEEEEEEEKIDIVFFDFIQPDILSALNTLQKRRTFTERDVGVFVEQLTANTLMQTYAQREWN